MGDPVGRSYLGLNQIVGAPAQEFPPVFFFKKIWREGSLAPLKSKNCTVRLASIYKPLIGGKFRAGVVHAYVGQKVLKRYIILIFSYFTVSQN